MKRWLAAGALLALAGCRIELGSKEESSASKATTVRIYSSMYQEVIDQVQPVLDAKLAKIAPGTTIE